MSVARCIRFHFPLMLLMCLITQKNRRLCVYSGCMQLFLSQTWAKWTSLNFSRCVVYFDNKFKAIWTTSKNLGWTMLFFVLTKLLFYQRYYSFIGFMHGRPVIYFAQRKYPATNITFFICTYTTVKHTIILNIV